jgi:hypothetical protein
MERSTEKTDIISQDAGTMAAEGRAQPETARSVVRVSHNDGDLGDGTFEFRVDNEAEPGDVVPALARLLIGLARQRRDRQVQKATAV